MATEEIRHRESAIKDFIITPNRLDVTGVIAILLLILNTYVIFIIS
jgi:hypothetical protein